MQTHYQYQYQYYSVQVLVIVYCKKKLVRKSSSVPRRRGLLQTVSRELCRELKWYAERHQHRGVETHRKYWSVNCTGDCNNTRGTQNGIINSTGGWRPTANVAYFLYCNTTILYEVYIYITTASWWWNGPSHYQYRFQGIGPHSDSEDAMCVLTYQYYSSITSYRRNRWKSYSYIAGSWLYSLWLHFDVEQVDGRRECWPCPRWKKTKSKTRTGVITNSVTTDRGIALIEHFYTTALK